MHEFSLVKALLEQVDSLRRRQAAERVVSIHVTIGAFAGVEAELLQEAYRVLVEQSPLRGAELQWELVPLEARCQDCDMQFPVQRFRFECPRCAGREVTILRGDDLRLESITVQ
jgi:hydrogenase nickel incorporation protein HypA/HybF